MNGERTERQRFFDALPFWVNGSLPAAEVAWCEAYLAAHPALQSQLELARAMAQQTRDAAQASLQDVPNDIGYALLKSRINGPLNAPLARPAKGPWQRLREWLAAPGPQGWRLAQGLAMGLVLGVSLLVVMPLARSPDDEATRWRSLGPGSAEGPLLRTSFKPQTSENDLRLALIEARVWIVAGPTRLGDYYLKPAPGQLANARATLQRSPFVQQLDEVPGLPPELTQ